MDGAPPAGAPKALSRGATTPCGDRGGVVYGRGAESAQRARRYLSGDGERRSSSSPAALSLKSPSCPSRSRVSISSSARIWSSSPCGPSSYVRSLRPRVVGRGRSVLRGASSRRSSEGRDGCRAGGWGVGEGEADVSRRGECTSQGRGLSRKCRRTCLAGPTRTSPRTPPSPPPAGRPAQGMRRGTRTAARSRAGRAAAVGRARRTRAAPA